MPNLTRPLTLTLALFLSLNASALSLHSEQRSDGTTALLLTNAPAPAGTPNLNEDPAIRSVLVDFLGYATGSYTNHKTMIVQQVLEALDSEYSAIEEGLPPGRSMITAMNDGNNGRDRAALLLNEKGQLMALGLVNGHCTVKSSEEPVTCNDLPDTVLTVFQPKGANKSDAAPLIAWSKQLPRLLAIRAESDDPETRAAAQKIATVEYVSTDPEKGAWSAAQLPSDFPKAMLPMLPKRAHLIGAGAHGEFTTPGMEGTPMDGDWDKMAGRPRHEFEVILRTYSDYADVLDFYKQQAKDAQISGNERKALVEGYIGGGTYKVEIRNREAEGTVITLSAWKQEV
ncbi:hypothetical protein KVG96_14015 [Pseudomonas sp. COR58]|uniref:Uncharacterized protein n=1 Tax=Pseudomonas ekonensis TaxID=2842353 RepID=A0ABS6PF12_9PSED|nr:hypothetical protein [Pseudomonas ekonensis]MBV4459072.1 hypothetical protein [Pseudomonas ekonensis]